ncbi:MAG: 50S ribosomal protein L29 [Tepidisphaerales bacterium]
MKINEIREKDDAALLKDMAEIRKQLFTLRTQAVTQKLEDPSKLGKLRRDIARIQTVLNERKRAATAK